MSVTGPEIDTPVPETAPESASQAVEPPDSATPAPESGESATLTPESTEPADPFEEFGGREAIEAAHRMYQASQSDDGVIQLFVEAGMSLGLGLKEIEALFTSQAAPADDDAEEPDPDEPLTRREFLEAQKRQEEAERLQQAEQTQKQAREAVQAAVKDLGLDPKDPSTQIILGLGDKYVKDDFSAENIASAVRRGHADYIAMVKKDADKYLKDKVAQADSVPSAPTGSSAPSEPAPPEPQSVAEAIKIARQRLQAARG